MNFSFGVLEYYLIAANIIGFILYGVNMFLYNHTANGQIDAVLTIVSFLGGSLGIVLFILLFDRKSVKENMMSRVFVASLLVIQVVAYLFFKSRHGQELHFAFWEFFAQHKVLTLYLITINIVTLIAFGIDKIRALEKAIKTLENKNSDWIRRIRIITLLGLAFAGGSVGALLAMYAFRHKTKIDYFTVGIPLIMIMQAVVIFYLMNV